MADTQTAPRPEHNLWVSRVLGVDADRPQARSRTTPLMPIWQTTREAIDQQVALLQQALRTYKDDDYDAIAEFGFNGLTGGRNTRLMAALMDYDRAPAPPTESRVAEAAEAYAELLAPDSVLDDYDANPLGVSINFRATLEKGITQLRKALADNRSAQP